MCECPHPRHHLHSGGSHGGRFGLLRFVICGQRGGDAVGRRHWEVSSETGLCGNGRRRLGYEGKKGDCVRYLAEPQCGNAVMEIRIDSGAKTLHKTAKKHHKIAAVAFFRKHATTRKNKPAAEANELIHVDRMESNLVDHQTRLRAHIPGAAAVAPRSMEA